MKLNPLDDRLVVKPIAADTTTPGGIVLPDVVKERPSRGEVVAAGPGRMSDSGTRCEMSVEEGDVVVFTKYSGSEIECDGENYIILRECDVLAIEEK